jgi:predicted dehydrogenase
MSVVAALPAPRFRVLGERGAFVKDGMDPQEEQLRAGGRPDDPAWGEEPAERWGVLRTAEVTEPVPTVPGNYGAFYEAVARSLLEGSPPPVDPVDAVRVLELLEAARLA